MWLQNKFMLHTSARSLVSHGHVDDRNLYPPCMDIICSQFQTISFAILFFSCDTLAPSLLEFLIEADSELNHTNSSKRKGDFLVLRTALTQKVTKI